MSATVCTPSLASKVAMRGPTPYKLVTGCKNPSAEDGRSLSLLFLGFSAFSGFSFSALGGGGVGTGGGGLGTRDGGLGTGDDRTSETDFTSAPRPLCSSAPLLPCPPIRFIARISRSANFSSNRPTAFPRASVPGRLP